MTEMTKSVDNNFIAEVKNIHIDRFYFGLIPLGLKFQELVFSFFPSPKYKFVRLRPPEVFFHCFYHDEQ